MTGIEKQVLNIVKEVGEANSETISRKVGVSAEYVTEICRGLVNDGYLGEGNGKYKLTLRALKAVSPTRTRGPIAVLKGGG